MSPRLAFAVAVFGAVTLFTGSAGCARPQTEEVDTSNPADFGFQRSAAEVLVEEGRVAYERYCIGCHGEAGEGNGRAARFLNPAPRNFVDAKYKFRTTRFGRYPTDEDLMRTLTQGLKGTSMPSWEFLTERTRRALVAYVQSLARRGWRDDPPIPYIDDPYRDDPDRSRAIARGEELYHGYYSCWTCHPAYVGEAKLREYLAEFTETAPPSSFRPDLHLAAAKESSDGETMYPTEFTRDYVKAGATVRDLYRTIGTGITGTAMPTWFGVDDVPTGPDGAPLVTDADLWAVAYYVHDLVLRRPDKLAPPEFEVRNRALRLTREGAQYIEEVSQR